MNPFRPKRLAPLCLSLALVLATLAFAQFPNPPILRTVDDHYNHLRTLRCRYTEHYAGMGLDRIESGTLTLRKPGLMRWSYDAPPGKVFVLDGHYAWFYTPGDAQVSRTPVKQLDDLRSPLRYLLGHTQLAKELDSVTVTPTGPAAAPTGYVIAGIPRGMSQRVRSVTLAVTPDGTIHSMKIEETDGAVTTFTFTDIQEDLPIPASSFAFTPPPGLPIVNAESPI